MKNLYAVTKTVRFELKPSEETFAYLSSKNNTNELGSDISQEEFFKKVNKIIEEYSEQVSKIEEILNLLINGDKTRIFIYPDFVEKLYKYSFIKRNVLEPKKLGKKVQRITIKKIDGYLNNFIDGNVKKYSKLLLQLEDIKNNYENGKGKINTETPKKVEILQIIRKIASIYLKTREIFSHLETEAVLRDEYSRGSEVSFLPELKKELNDFFASEDLLQKSEKYLKTITGERGLFIGSFSLNKYAVNNFKEISKIEDDLEKLEKKLITKKKCKFKALQSRETAYWEKWNNIVNSDNNYSLLKANCPKKGKRKDNYKQKLKEIKKEIYQQKTQEQEFGWRYKQASNEYGNIEKEFISLQRELEEVSDSKYFGSLIKESDDVFYLALTERLDQKKKKKNLQDLDILKNNFSDDGELEVLDFYKLSFSAFEKLCLLPESTLGVDVNEDKNIRNLWENIKYKRFDAYEFKKYTWDKKKTKEENFAENKRFEEKQKIWKNNFYKNRENNIQKIAEYFEKILEKHSSLFQATFNVEELKLAESFTEFEREFNKQGYKISKNNISKEALLQLTKSGEILLFQIFCKDFILDENFALTDFDKTRIGFKSTGKDNLHTRYWKDFFQNIENKDFWEKWRLYGEGKIFFREKDETPNISRRYKDDKYFVSLGFQIYPNEIDVKKEVKYDKNFQEKHIKEYKQKNPQYVIGIDQGVNSLVSYCVIDSNGNIVKDENEKAEIGDLSLVISNGENKGKFVEVEDTLIVGEDKGVWNEEEKVLELATANERVLKGDESVKVFDYAEAMYAESYKRRDKIVNYKEGDLVSFDEVTDLKKGYASFVLHKIEQLAKKYSPAIISLEFMQDTKNKSNFVNTKGEGKKIEDLEEKHKNPKTYRFGTSTVEAIEDALIEKFRYWNGKVNQEEEQLTPFIIKKSDFYKKNAQWGNIIFINEENTSSICPKCNEKAIRCKDPLDKKEWKQAGFHTDEDIQNIYGQFRKVNERVQHNPNSDCNWNSAETDRDYPEIKNGDYLAAYNIAKRGVLNL